MNWKNIVFDFDKIVTKDDFYKAYKKELSLPEYFGNNLDALYDCITGYIYLPTKLCFINLSIEQLQDFSSLIQTMKDAQKELGDDFVFEYSLKNSAEKN